MKTDEQQPVRNYQRSIHEITLFITFVLFLIFSITVIATY